MRQRQRLLFVSAISILEIARLVTLQQYALASSIDDFVAEATADDGFQLCDLTPRILIESTRLPGEIHRDPSDRLLVATAREHGLTLVTRDKRLLRYAKQGHLNARKP
jgi:PIN domain nuclease of toxin-antitoxin system